MSSKSLTIAIDGPAGAGKSTVAKRLASKLGLRYLDTGAMYRCVALAAMRAGIATDDHEALTRLASQIRVEFGPGDPPAVMLDGVDVSNLIRTPEIGERASAVSAVPGVRRVLQDLQKRMVAEGGFTLDGRDVTTVIAPHAQVRVFMTASLETRAQRRYLELKEKGLPADLQEIKALIAQRDMRDSTREDSPLMIGEGVTLIDTDGLSIEQVVEKVLELIPD